MKKTIAVIGEGQLAELAAGELSRFSEVRHGADVRAGTPRDTALVLLMHDSWPIAVHQEAEKVLRRAGIPWLRGFVAFGEAVVGPLVRPGARGCSRCADRRRHMAGRDRREMAELVRRLAASETPPDAWSSRTGLRQAALLAAEEAGKVLRGEPCRLEGSLYLLNLRTLKSSLHCFLPDPQCPVCGRLPEDTPEAAQSAFTSGPSPKIHPGSYRCRPLEELKTVLPARYLDYRTGLINGKMRDLVSPFADASVNLPLFAEDEVTAGRTHSFAESELTAILEALERYCGLTPRGKRTVVRGSYRQLKDRALNPLRAGVHSEKQYASPGFPFRPFDPDRPIRWVWGYSYLQERPILVPELLAYYSLACGEGFVQETSNGCALGSSLAEAVFYGILEVIERDSFLLTWYARLPIPRLDSSSSGDRELVLMIERLRETAGYDILLFDATMEHGIPAIWAMAKNRKPKGVNLVCAAGAHPDPVRAAKSAVHELAGMLLTLDGKFESNREQYLRMYRDSALVRQMDDHSMLYALPQAEERLQFLLAPERPVRTFAERFPPPARHADLADDLRDLLRALGRRSLEVIAVDQTAPELELSGLHCVKVLIPGMLPMTFGHHMTRLTGLERVLNVPAELGYADQPLHPDKLNPYPHPFP